MSFFKIDVVEIPYHVIKQEEVAKIELTPKDFGGSFLSPKFINNPVFVIDVIEQMNYQIRLEFSNPQVNAMICVIGVDTDLQDIRDASYSYFTKQANAGQYSLGVSELNCLLDVGRYLLICSLLNTQELASTMKVHVSSYDTKLSDHPEVFQRNAPNTPPSFKIARLNMKTTDAKFPHKEVYSDVWPSGRSDEQKKQFTASYSMFHTNPGVIITVTEQTTVRFHLSSRGYAEYFATINQRDQEQEPPSLSVCIMKINNVSDLQPVNGESEATSAAWGCWTR